MRFGEEKNRAFSKELSEKKLREEKRVCELKRIEGEKAEKKELLERKTEWEKNPRNKNRVRLRDVRCYNHQEASKLCPPYIIFRYHHSCHL